MDTEFVRHDDDRHPPGIAPPGWRVELPHLAPVSFEERRVAFERIHRGQASLLVEIGLLDDARLPATGSDQARLVLDPHRRCRLIDRVKAL